MESTYTREDIMNDKPIPKALIDRAYELMAENCIDPDYMCDHEADYVSMILDDGPWSYV